MAESKEEKEARETKEREDKARDDKARRDKNPRLDAESDEDYDKRMDALAKSESVQPEGLMSALDAFRKSVTDSLDNFRKDFGGRMDAVEKWRDDRRDEGESPEDKKRREEAEAKERDDKARRDAAEAEAKENKERADVKDREVVSLKERLAALEARTPLSADHADYPVMVGFQARADRTYSLHGQNAPRPMEGETPVAYRRRLVVALQKHSPEYKDIDLSGLNDDKMLAIVEKRVFADAESAARRPVDLQPNELRKVVSRDDVGRNVTEYHGDPQTWMAPYMMPFRMVRNITRHPESTV